MAYTPYSQSQFNITRLIVVGGLLMLAYMLYNLTVTIYENYQIDRHIKNFETKNAQLQEENLKKLEDYKYYTSDAYIEKIAKQNLNLVKPGEELIIIGQTSTKSVPEGQVVQEAEARSMANLSNPQKWWIFLFEKNPYRY